MSVSGVLHEVRGTISQSQWTAAANVVTTLSHKGGREEGGGGRWRADKSARCRVIHFGSKTSNEKLLEVPLGQIDPHATIA